jgi:hypothetical protein
MLSIAVFWTPEKWRCHPNRYPRTVNETACVIQAIKQSLVTGLFCEMSYARTSQLAVLHAAHICSYLALEAVLAVQRKSNQQA